METTAVTGQPQEQQAQEPAIDWKGLTGFESPDAIKETVSRYSQLEAEYNELKNKASVSPFASPLIEQMNKLAADGKDSASLTRFITLQSQDFDNMSSEDILRWEMRIAMPKWDESKINDWIESEYPFAEDGDEDKIKKDRQRSLKMDTRAEDARAKLNQMKVDAGKPDEAKQQQQAAMQQRQQQLAGVADGLIGQLSEIPITHEGEGWKYELKYKPQLSPELRRQLLNTVVADHAGRGTPLTEQGLQVIRGDIEKLTRMLSMDDMIKAIINDTRSSMLEQVTKEVSNSAPPKSPAVPPVKPQQNQRQEFIKQNGKVYI